MYYYSETLKQVSEQIAAKAAKIAPYILEKAGLCKPAAVINLTEMPATPVKTVKIADLAPVYYLDDYR